MTLPAASRRHLRCATAIALVAAAAGCARPLRTAEVPQTLRTADIVHAPVYREPVPAAPPAAPAAPEVPAAIAAPVAVATPVTVPAPASAAVPLAEPAPAAAPKPVAPAAVPAQAPVPASAAVAAPQPAAAEPARTPPQPAARPAPAASQASRWVVQVGVFAVPGNAEAVRARVAAQLAQAGLAAPLRVERIGSRSHVLVGDAADLAAAQALAAQLRSLLRQDVVILRR